MRLDQLPEELLLQIALYLPDSAMPRHLKGLCLTSRKLRPIAQEALHTTARLVISCGCHPKVNALVKLLRTILDRPDLASKVKTLRFRAVRKQVMQLYAEQGFEFLGFRGRCILKLEELGYDRSHPWWRSIENSIESAFGGLLLVLLPNLTDLDFWIKDHQRGPPSSECISGLWGGTTPPQAILHRWKNISHFVTGDTSMLKCGIDFEKLTSLDLRTVSIGTVLRLNGPGSLQGAENVTNLTVTASIQFADRPLLEKAETEFSELLDALACRELRHLKILFINDGYHIGDDLTTELNAGYFLGQLHSIQNTIETLSIIIETTEEDGELDWLVDMCQHPTKSLKEFKALKSLVIPQAFVFNAQTAGWNKEDNCQPKNLPPKLEQLELLWPHESVEEWAEGFLDENYYGNSGGSPVQLSPTEGRTFTRLTLTCRDDVGIGASYFTEGVDKIWWDLSTVHGIEAEVHDQLRDTRQNLAGLYEDEDLEEEDSEIDDEDVDEEVLEDEYDAIHPRRGLSGAPRPPFESLEDQTTILRYLRSLTRSEGITPNEIGRVLDLSWDRVTRAAAQLLFDGNIRFTGVFPQRHRYHFVIESDELRRQDRLQTRFGEEEEAKEAEEAGWETDDSMPELEPYDPEVD